MANGSGVGPRDSNLILRASGEGNLTATESDTFQVNPEMYKEGLSVYVNFPSTPTGTSPTCKVQVEGEDTGAEVEVTHTDNVTEAASPENDNSFPSTLILDVPWTDGNDYKVTLTVGGTTPNFGAVEVWVARRAVSRVP